MKRIKCDSCAGIWMIENADLEKLTVCPYCGVSISGEIDFSEYDTLDKAIYGAVTKMGKTVLLNPKQLCGFMMDTAPELKKEIRIFSKTVNEDYASHIKSAFEENIEAADVTLRKLRQIFIEEEGLSETWADKICGSLHGALLYYKGNRVKRLINVNVVDFESPTIIKETIIAKPKPLSANNKLKKNGNGVKKTNNNEAPSVKRFFNSTIDVKFPVLASPATGTIVPMEKIPDAAFSSGKFGTCCGVEPIDGKVYAPTDGWISTLYRTLHAVEILATNNVKIILHIGVDTKDMNGNGFKAFVKQFERVKKGQLLLEMDLEKIRKAGHPSTVIMNVINGNYFSGVEQISSGYITAGEALMKVNT